MGASSAELGRPTGPPPTPPACGRGAIERFAADLATLDASPAARFGLAVSGGPDSLALLLLAHASIPGRFAVATVDHRLRAESADEAAFVAALCAARGIAHATLPVAVAPSGNLQANARAARYAALAKWAAERSLGALVTAHHGDDQAETLLMRLNRGAGARGLAGMRARSATPGQPGLPLLRPLLGWRRAELAKIVAAAGLVPVQDPSNADPRFARPALRRRLSETQWLDASALAASAGHLADADAALDWATQREWDAAVEQSADHVIYRPEAPRAIRLRVLERIVAQHGSEGTPRGAELARFLAALERGEVATLAGLRGDGGDASAWTFVTTPPRRAG